MISNEEFLLKNLKAVEVGEAYLMNIVMLLKLKRFEEALKMMSEKEDKIKDKQSLLEYKAECLLKLGRVEEAKDVYEILIGKNNSCKKYYIGYLGGELESSEVSGREVKEKL